MMSFIRSRPLVQSLIVISLGGAFALGACTSPTVQDPAVDARVMPPPAATTPVPAAGTPDLVFYDRSANVALGGYTAAQLDTIASMPMAIFTMHTLFTPGGAATARALKERNPDLVVLGALDVLTTPLFWDSPGTRSFAPMAGELFDLLSPRWFETEEGEPARMWDNARMVNPMRGAGYDRDLVRRYLDVVCRYAQQYPGVVDGVFFDYMSEQPWLYPLGTQSGTIDLDGDGVPSQDDPHEKNAWVGYQIELLADMQERFGPGWIQIANGKLGLVEPEAARRLAGVYLENFPSLVWGQLPQEAITIAEGLSEPGVLTPRRGRTWCVLGFGANTSDTWITMRRLTSALTSHSYLERPGREGFFPGLDEGALPDLGAALGPMQSTTRDGQTEFTRAFENGTVRLVFDGWGRVQDASLVPPVGSAN